MNTQVRTTTPEAEGIEEWQKEFDEMFNFLTHAIDFYKGETYTNINKRGKDHLDEIKVFIHHQLQKARHDWLREEIVTLEGMIKEEKQKGTYDTWQTGWQVGFIEAIQTIIDRYQKELDHSINREDTP